MARHTHHTRTAAAAPTPLHALRRLAARWAAPGLLAGALAVAALPAQSAISVFEGTSSTPAGLLATRDAFRAAVGGGSTAGANGDFGGLRREINWDGVPDPRADPNALPGNFFNVNSPRGLVMTTPGSGFAVSAAAISGTPVLFGFPSDLQTFSAQRLFATVGSRVTDLRFFVPGTNTAASTSAFGAVFVDVEDNSTAAFTQVEFFDASETLLFSRHVTPAGNQGLSFLGGVAGAGERIAHVRITTPDNYLLSNGQRANEAFDFVVMDDFLYATPSAVPEPAAAALLLLGLGGLLGAARRRG